MSRGIVMETGSKHVIVLMPDGQFRKVRTALRPQIGEEFAFAEQRRLRRPRKLYSFSAGAAALLLLMFAPLWVQQMSKQSPVVAYLTIDVNPSIELGIDKEEHVVELRPINVDGADVAKGLKFKGLPLPEVTEAIMDRISAGPYLNSGEGDVVIASVAVGDRIQPATEVDLTEDMDAAVRSSLAKTEKGRQLKVEITKLSAPQEVRDEGKREGLSSGKMAFYLMAKKQGYRLSIEQLKHESIHNAAKSMGGVAAVMGEDAKADSGKKTASGGGAGNGKGTESAKNGSGGKAGATGTSTQPVPAGPGKTPAASVSPKADKAGSEQTLREQQKQQLKALLEQERQKHQDRQGNKRHAPNKDAKKPGAVINIDDRVANNGKHSPGNNHRGSQGRGGYQSGRDLQNKKDSAKLQQAPPAQQQSKSGVGQPGGQGSKRSDDNSQGGKKEAQNASDGRHNGVSAGSINGSDKQKSSKSDKSDKSDKSHASGNNKDKTSSDKTASDRNGSGKRNDSGSTASKGRGEGGGEPSNRGGNDNKQAKDNAKSASRQGR